MAKNQSHKGAGSNSLSKMSSKENVRLGDIETAAKSSMEPKDYSGGYPTATGTIWNGRLVGRTKGKK